MRLTKRSLKNPANVWFNTWAKPVVVLFVLLANAACGVGDDYASETTRNQMLRDAENALTEFDCAKALANTEPLYLSKYSDNTIRMLHANAYACKANIHYYKMISEILEANWGNVDQVFKSLVKIFPSVNSDSKLASSWYSLDVLQTVLKPGVVTLPVDAVGSGWNPGSLLSRDRIDDANLYLVFMSMSTIGTSLNRFGYNEGENPVDYNYSKRRTLPWITKDLVLSDQTMSACSLAAGLYNLIDSIEAVGGLFNGNVGTTLSTISSQLETVINTAADLQCLSPSPLGDGYSATECNAAKARIRYRGACSEQNPAASVAAGVVKAINAGWL